MTNIEESKIHMVSKKSGSKGSLLYDSIYMTKGNIIGSESRSVIARGWQWRS